MFPRSKVPVVGISVAAARTERSSVGVEVDREYMERARCRFLDETGGLFGRAGFEVGDCDR